MKSLQKGYKYKLSSGVVLILAGILFTSFDVE